MFLEFLLPFYDTPVCMHNNIFLPWNFHLLFNSQASLTELERVWEKFLFLPTLILTIITIIFFYPSSKTSKMLQKTGFFYSNEMMQENGRKTWIILKLPSLWHLYCTSYHLYVAFRMLPLKKKCRDEGYSKWKSF